jgi:hypothetical protein
MPIDLFGFSLGRKGKESPKPTTTDIEKTKNMTSFVAPDEYDGSLEIEAGGIFGTYVDFSGKIKNENDLIFRFRSMALFPEVDMAITDIVNDAVVIDENKDPVSIMLDNVKLSDNIKTKMETEFSEILKLLNFNNKGFEIFRRWYVDSKLFYHIIVDEKNPKKGIIEIRPIDPVKIQKIRKVEKDQIRKNGVTFPIVKNIEEFFLYIDTDKTSVNPTSTSGLKIAPDSICYVHSGSVDTGSKQVIGYLQKAIRPLNMLRQIEDAVVIYRISRAPERRVFYIDVGNLPKQKAEQYLKGIMNRYRQKVVYDADTGEIRDDKRHMSMMEDFWLPRREGGRGTEITTLDGGQNLGEMEDVIYLQKKLYRALNVPPSRLEADNGFNMGRSAEITRDEVKFYRFVDRLRLKFSEVFLQLLRSQLILKGIIKQEDWDSINQDIGFSFKSESYFHELKETEILKERAEMLRDLDEYIGKYYSIEWVRKNVLRQDEAEMKKIDAQIKKEEAAGDIPDETEQEDGEQNGKEQEN